MGGGIFTWLEPGMFFALTYILSASARLWVWHPPWTKKFRLTAEHKAVTPHADNTTQQPSIKPPEWLLHTQITTTHSRVSNTPERETSVRVHRNTWISTGCVMDKKCIVWALASYALFIHAFSRQSIFLVFLNSEAVSTPGIFDTQRECVIYQRQIWFFCEIYKNSCIFPTNAYNKQLAD